MSRTTINTTDPIALRYLMTETIFGVGEGATSVDAAVVPEVAETRSEAPDTASTGNLPPRFSFYGGNKRHYLFLTQEGQYEWMSETALDAFNKTLRALKLTADDVAVVNVAKLPRMPSLADLSAFFNPKVVVCLGVPFPGLRPEGITLFEAPSFDEMLSDAEKKRVFWTTIKTLLV